MRNIWNWALTFLIIETFSVVQIIRGLFGNITAEAIQKIEQVQSTIAFRNKQLEAAITIIQIKLMFIKEISNH